MIRKQLLAAALAATLTSGLAVSVMNLAVAADGQSATTEAPAKDQSTKKTAQADFVKVSEDTLTGMRDVREARLAIFDGQTEQARTYVDAAVTRMENAVKDADKFALDVKAPKADDSYVPFDANLAVLNSFEPTAEKTKQIATATAHLKKGNKQEAIDTLKLAEIDVAVTTSMVPVNYAKAHIEQASKLISEHKYYEANLALKAVDDAVIVETYAIDSVPKPKAENQS